jgi:FdhD protein
MTTTFASPHSNPRIGRARGKRFIALAGEQRIAFDQDIDSVQEESGRFRRKAAMHDE